MTSNLKLKCSSMPTIEIHITYLYSASGPPLKNSKSILLLYENF